MRGHLHKAIRSFSAFLIFPKIHCCLTYTISTLALLTQDPTCGTTCAVSIFRWCFYYATARIVLHQLSDSDYFIDNSIESVRRSPNSPICKIYSSGRMFSVRAGPNGYEPGRYWYGLSTSNVCRRRDGILPYNSNFTTYLLYRIDLDFY